MHSGDARTAIHHNLMLHLEIMRMEISRLEEMTQNVGLSLGAIDGRSLR